MIPSADERPSAGELTRPTGPDLAATFRAILGNSSLPMAATEGALHTVRYANPAFCQFVRYDEQSVVGQPLPELLKTTRMADTLALLDHVYRSGGTASVSAWPPSNSGPAVHVTYAAWLVPAEPDHLAGLLVQAIDTSEQELSRQQAADAADELREINGRLLQAGLQWELRAETHLALNAALRESETRLQLALAERDRLLASEHAARDQAEAALHTRDEFLGIAAHELRSPLTAIKGSAQVAVRLLDRGTLDNARARHQFDNIVTSSARLEALLTDLLDVSRMREAGLVAQLEPMDLGQLARTVAGRYQENADGSRVVCDVPAEPVRVEGDRGRLEQVLDNVLSNAVKYSPGGGEVVLQLRRVSDGVRLTVRDGGIGVPAGEAERVFEPFRRAPNARAHGLPGIGLGLHVSRQIAHAHGGTLHAESQGEGTGTTLVLWLPTPQVND